MALAPFLRGYKNIYVSSRHILFFIAGPPCVNNSAIKIIKRKHIEFLSTQLDLYLQFVYKSAKSRQRFGKNSVTNLFTFHAMS